MVSAARRLRAAGVDAPQHEARLLMALATGLATADLIVKGHQPVPAKTAERFEDMVRRREGREPFQHIAGFASFFGMEFISDARALVPRADSEVVVEAALSLMPEGQSSFVADLGAGSGCLLAAILMSRSKASGVGVEADADAASLALENIKRHGLEARASIAVMSWSDWTGWNTADLIISNPPYIRHDVVATLEPEVRLHDPLAALDGGEDGLDAYREIVALARSRMRPKAALVLEIGFDQKDDVTRLLRTAGFSEVGSARDLGGNDRVVWAIQPGS